MAGWLLLSSEWGMVRMESLFDLGKENRFGGLVLGHADTFALLSFFYSCSIEK